MQENTSKAICEQIQLGVIDMLREKWRKPGLGLLYPTLSTRKWVPSLLKYVKYHKIKKFLESAQNNH